MIIKCNLRILIALEASVDIGLALTRQHDEIKQRLISILTPAVANIQQQQEEKVFWIFKLRFSTPLFVPNCKVSNNWGLLSVRVHISYSFIVVR